MLILGHRGDRQKFDDNSIKGISSAFERGADGVEIDVHFKPGKGIYLVHPYLHDPMKVYPKLDEVFEKFRDKGLLQIEIKFLEIKGLETLKKLIKRYNVSNYVLTSSIFPMLRYISEVFPKSKINLLSTQLIEEWWTYDFGNYFLFSYLKLAGANGIDTGYPDFWTKKRVDYFHNYGVRTSGHLATVSKEELENALSCGLDTCTADNLDILKWRK